ncbi:hypothetical protein MMPV_001121 [Pyropia vietnamensis]
MSRSYRGLRPLPPHDGRVTKAATHSTTTRATGATTVVTSAAAAAAAAATAPPPSRAWIGDCADSALLEEYYSGSDRDDYPAAPVEAVSAAPLGGPVASRWYTTESTGSGGGGGSLPFSYANELLLLPLDATNAAAGSAASAGAPPSWMPPPQAKVEPPDGSAYGTPLQPLASRPTWEREAMVGATTATAAVRLGGGVGAPLPAARPLAALSPVAALSPLAVSSFDPHTFFDPLELTPLPFAEPSDVTGATAAVSDPDGAHLHKRELADPPSGNSRAGGDVDARTVEVEAASSSGGSYVEARVSPSTLTAVSRPAPGDAGGVAASRRAVPGLAEANGERRLEWDKPLPPAVVYYPGGGVGGVVGFASSAPPAPSAAAMAAMTTATATTNRGASTLASSAVPASGRVPGVGGDGAGGSSNPPPPPASGGCTGKPKRFACERCGQLFTERSNRKKHYEAVHLKLRPHGCAICGAEFAAKVNLHKHILSVHNKARPFPCNICSAAFGERNKRDKHTRTVHGGERPWTCNSCGHAFGQRSDLVRHAKIVHEGVRPHACPQPGCDKSFGRRGSLMHHLAVIHKVTTA